MDPQASADLLYDIEQEYQYEDATTGQRFLNYLIDLISFYLFTIAVMALIMIASQSDEFINAMDSIPTLVDRLLSLVFFGLYISVIEGLSKGRTLGKLITGTVAVRDDGEPFNWGKALARGFSRIVPFEPFSGLGGHPWHDTWTNTRVVKVRK